MALDLLLAQYPKQMHVRDRNYSGLIAWSASMKAQSMPEEPEVNWVRQRIVADLIPAQPMIYVERTLGFFLQDPATVTNIREYLSAWNDEAAETSLSAQIAAVISAFMPRFAAAEIGAKSAAGVDDLCEAVKEELLGDPSWLVLFERVTSIDTEIERNVEGEQRTTVATLTFALQYSEYYEPRILDRLDHLHIDVDVIRPAADPNIRFPGPDGRIEVAAEFLNPPDQE